MSRLGQFFNFVRFVWNHSEQLVTLFQLLPAGLRAAGAGIEVAGDGARVAGRTIGGSAAMPVNAADVIGEVALAINQCHLQVKAVSQEMRNVANALDQVKVPTVTPKTEPFDFRMIGLGQWNLVTGLNVGQASLFSTVTSNMRAQANVMENNVGGQLLTASQRLTSVKQTLDDAGGNIKALGDSLKDGGTALKQLGS